MANGDEAPGLARSRKCGRRARRAQPAPRRRRGSFQFSVRGLLVLILVIGCGLGWIRPPRRRAGRAQRPARSRRSTGPAGGWCPIRARERHQRRLIIRRPGSGRESGPGRFFGVAAAWGTATGVVAEAGDPPGGRLIGRPG